MSGDTNKQKVVVVGAGPVGALAALYAAQRGDNVEVYELRAGWSALIQTKSRYHRIVRSSILE
jgi:2-polyprenyl-6-methoxyphenol hydroxylase-like FAD-dependent oxidoreductase